MYTKLGLGLLAAAGLTFGVVGMRAGGASPTSTACTNPASGVSAGPSGGAAAGDQNGSNTGTGTGTEGDGNGLGGGNGSGRGSGTGSGTGDNGPTTTLPPKPGDNGNPSTSTTADDRFLVLGGHTDESELVDGTATVPRTNSGATGRSRILSHLIRIDAHTDVYGRR